jgi:hypothetical protein
MEATFKTAFKPYVCPGDTLQTEIDGIVFTARIDHDPFAGIDDDDIYNPDQEITGCNDQQQAQLMAARSAYNRDEWFFCGIVLSARHKATGATWESLESLWRIEANYPGSYNTYLTEVANELLASAAEQVQAKIRELSAVAIG